MKIFIIIYLISTIVAVVGNALIVLRVKEILESKNIKYTKENRLSKKIRGLLYLFCPVVNSISACVLFLVTLFVTDAQLEMIMKK
ncbi:MULTISPECIES: hypothetical protein [Clostridium]|uniref:Uncharacterized protein n=1 Tax=Clostridium carnis TaxID=1530 RepID=A0ABY6SSB9_9CLOT|nr:hypothetical protein [Clostridium carnis]CAI3560743.1 conserved hypothetical protein [Clostridium neonatale]CAI3562082.1 conserved hypothetical protein [Clostridium neonatale]CAI3583017.1 conserved hypothetical protein [Clostridium neonatale]CAI3622780.1 conserved hypothetical protein [Clostridium neonatale]CAI3675288.1 conserved hypothetical protein [Clostridium neonatale]